MLNMTEREYLLKLVEALPEEKIGEVISGLTDCSDDEFDEKKFDIVKTYVFEKYRAAFEELAK